MATDDARPTWPARIIIGVIVTVGLVQIGLWAKLAQVAIGD